MTANVADDYGSFLASKVVVPQPAGFEVGDDIGPQLFDWQRRIVRWSLRQGRSAIFADCGLGKTAMQLVWADAVVRHTGRPVLILAPLAVGPQTVAEGVKFGVGVTLCKTQADVSMGVNVANYAKLLKGHFQADGFAGVVLDESSILKNYMGKTKRLLIESFGSTPYRLACTATPAPNDHMELGNHAEFLGVMGSNEMLARWFIADQKNCGNYRLKGHAEADFWRWVCSWAVCCRRPSDVGGDDSGYELPRLVMHQHIVTVNPMDRVEADKDGQLSFAREGKLSATGVHKEMRLTAAARSEKLADVVNNTLGQWVVWCNTDYEADELKARLVGCVEIRGSEKDESKERKLADFAAGSTRVLLSKPSICGFGLNWQQCNQVAFVGMSYSQEQFYQAVRRVWRFGQKRDVQCHVVMADTEGEVLASVQRKERDQEAMIAAMCAAMRNAGLGSRGQAELVPVKREVASGQKWTMRLGDCVEVLRDVADASVDLSVFSPPFAGLYIYSDALQDMGNASSDVEFMQHFGFLAPELLRVTVPGRLAVVHCKDLPRYAGRDGTAGLKDFPGQVIALFESHGWSYHSRVTIWKCPVTERERTNNAGLLYNASFKRDTSICRQGMADYLIVFRRPPAEGCGLMSSKPLVRPTGLTEYVGSSDPRVSDYHPSPFARSSSADPALAVWQRYAEPVWWDVDQMDTLNEALARESKDERHICPLQLGVIRRAVQLWSDPGDTVLSPFAGIGSEGVCAVEMGRRFVGVELKRAYWQHACKHLSRAEQKAGEKTLLDLLEQEQAA